MKCKECGAEVSPTEKFCGNCGAPTESVETPQEEPLATRIMPKPSLPEADVPEEPAPPPEYIEEPAPEHVEEPVAPIDTEPQPELPPLYREPVIESEPLPPPPPPPPVSATQGGDKKKTGIIIAIVVIVLLLICCCCIGGGIAFFNSDAGKDIIDELGLFIRSVL